MTKLREELNRIIKLGKQALIENDLDLAIHSFERAIQVASEASPSLNSIIGISYANISLAFGKKGQRRLALENINTATEFFPVNPINPLAYTSVLLGLGVEFQEIELFECSIIILKDALTMARNKTTKVDLKAISIVARNLAFSYSMIGNNISSAKLFRIAADLEDEPQICIDLYRNSAYLYYQEEMKEFTLNILQTAFEKAGILGDTNNQIEIAHFQGLVAYEIVINYLQRSNLKKAIAYLDLCKEKFTFTKNSFWIIKALFEKAMILESMGKIWKRNKVLQKIIQFKINKKNEEYIVKAILLLTVHALEGKNYYKAEQYIQQVSEPQLEDLKPKLRKKIREIQDMLKLSLERGQLNANLRFSRKDLDLPIETLIPEAKTPSQEIFLKQEDLEKLKAPKLELSTPLQSLSSKLKSPSIEALQELFDTSEEVRPPPVDQEPVSTVTQDQVMNEGPQEVDSSVILGTTSEDTQEKELALERLFKAHQPPLEPSAPLSSVPSVSLSESTEFEPILHHEPMIESVEELPQATSVPTPVVSHNENARSEVVGRLQKAGWTVELNFVDLARGGAEPDIIAVKGLIRKNRKLIFFAENPADAEICSFLLQSNLDRGEKIVFLLNGDPRDANISVVVKLVTQIDQLL
ncbi:MAG: hypothetical protein ACXADY_01225 [Candidatus Hodarchaeales archaeon]|jgi:tetratricopeptide (TPR) repeat protein